MDLLEDLQNKINQRLNPKVSPNIPATNADGSPALDASGKQVTLPDLFQPNLFPWNASVNTGGSSSQQSSSSQSSSSSGINKALVDPFLKTLFPELTKSVTALPGNIEDWYKLASGAASSKSRDLLNTQAKGLIAELNQRGVLSGSVGADALAEALSTVAGQEALYQYQAGADTAKMKMGVPSLLGQLGELGRRSDASSSSKSSGSSTSTTNAVAYSENPLAPYTAMQELLSGI